MQKMKPITYASDQARDYAQGLSGSRTLEQLREMVESYREIAQDAVNALPKDIEEFLKFRSGLSKERKGKFSGLEFSNRFGSLIMPDIIVKVSMVAEKFKAPWGLCYLRMKEQRKI